MSKRDEGVKQFMRLPGIGKLKAEALFDAGFETLDDLSNATLEDIGRAEGIGPKLAEAIKAGLEKILAEQEEPPEHLKELVRGAGLPLDLAQKVFDAGFRSVEDLRRARFDDLANIEDVGEAGAERIKDRVINREESVSEFQEIPGVGAAQAKALWDAGHHTRYDLQRATVEELADIEGIGQALAEAIKAAVGDEGAFLPTTQIEVARAETVREVRKHTAKEKVVLKALEPDDDDPAAARRGAGP